MILASDFARASLYVLGGIGWRRVPAVVPSTVVYRIYPMLYQHGIIGDSARRPFLILLDRLRDIPVLSV